MPFLYEAASKSTPPQGREVVFCENYPISISTEFPPIPYCLFPFN